MGIITKMKIIKATSDKTAEIVAIENASFTCPWSEKSFNEAFASPNVTIYAAVSDDDAVVGFACIMTLDEESEILNIAVAPTSRKCGIGEALLHAMIENAQANGVLDFYLEVRESNATARHLYEKNGFIPLGVRRKYYIKPVEDAIVMRKSVGAGTEEEEECTSLQ